MSQSPSPFHLRSLFCEAYHWLCRNRKKHPPSSDIWDFLRTWQDQADALMNAFWGGRYQFDVQKRTMLSNNEVIDLWSPCDALVLKVLTWIVQDRLQPFVPKVCYHLKGNGGLKGAIRQVIKEYPNYKFFCKTDVRSYYDSIDHYTLLMKLHEYITDRKIINYVLQFLNRCVEWGGLYRDVTKGISRGSSLSPLLGTLYLLDLDQRLKNLDVKYFRYMDDILIFASTRWKLKKAIRVLNQTFNDLKLEKHPDKTVIGRTCRGFDFLGYRFEPQGFTLAKKTITNFITKALRLYEQEPGGPLGSARLGEYVQRWFRWVQGRRHPDAEQTSSNIPDLGVRILNEKKGGFGVKRSWDGTRCLGRFLVDVQNPSAMPVV